MPAVDSLIRSTMSLAEMLSDTARRAELEGTNMYATTSEMASTSAFCVWPSEVPFKQYHCDEVDLVARLQGGDETAFREIVDRYASKIYRVSYGILRNRDDADEIAQEVFTKIYFSIRTFEGRSSLCWWIYRIAVNECYGFLR